MNGEDPNVPDGDGYFQLLDAHAVERDGVTRIAAIAECNAGGVGWPNQLLVFDTAGQFLSTSDLWDYDWEALGFWGPSRNGVTAVSTDSGMLRLDLLMYNPEDPLCCATGTAMVTVDVFGDTPRISAIEAHSNQIAELAPSSESAGNDVALCADHGEAVMAGATENFDVAICFADQSRNSAVYVGKKRETGDSIVLPVCRHTTDWQAENSGYEYWIAYDLISGVGFLQVDDPSGETIVLETINVAFDNEASAAHLAGSDC